MPRPGMRWYHLILHTHGSWLHGDPRGFRTREHRIHSSGDYRNPPPAGEHAGLHQYHSERSGPVVKIPEHLYDDIGQAFLRKCRKGEHQVLAVSVGATHSHLQVELPDDYIGAQQFSYRLKQAGSHAVRDTLPGTIWARGSKPIEIRDRAHQKKVFRYICDHAKEGDWVRTYRMRG